MPYSSNVSNRGKEFVELIRGVIPNESPKVAIRKITAVKENGKYDITDEGDNTSSGTSDIINQSVYNFKVNDDALILFYGDYAKSPVIIGKVSPQSSDEKIFQMQNDIETLKRASNVGTVVKTEEITTSSGGTGTTYVSGDGIDISGNVISNTYNQVTGTEDTGGTNWTKIKIGGVERNIPTGGGGGSYTAGGGILIDDNVISVKLRTTTDVGNDSGLIIGGSNNGLGIKLTNDGCLSLGTEGLQFEQLRNHLSLSGYDYEGTEVSCTFLGNVNTYFDFDQNDFYVVENSGSTLLQSRASLKPFTWYDEGTSSNAIKFLTVNCTNAQSNSQIGIKLTLSSYEAGKDSNRFHEYVYIRVTNGQVFAQNYQYETKSVEYASADRSCGDIFYVSGGGGNIDFYVVVSGACDVKETPYEILGLDHATGYIITQHYGNETYSGTTSSIRWINSYLIKNMVTGIGGLSGSVELGDGLGTNESNGIKVKLLNDTSGLNFSNGNLYIKLRTINNVDQSGLIIDNNGLGIKLKSSNSGLAIDATGLFIDETIIQHKLSVGAESGLSINNNILNFSYSNGLAFDESAAEIQVDFDLVASRNYVNENYIPKPTNPSNLNVLTYHSTTNSWVAAAPQLAHSLIFSDVGHSVHYTYDGGYEKTIIPGTGIHFETTDSAMKIISDGVLTIGPLSGVITLGSGLQGTVTSTSNQLSVKFDGITIGTTDNSLKVLKVPSPFIATGVNSESSVINMNFDGSGDNKILKFDSNDFIASSESGESEEKLNIALKCNSGAGIESTGFGVGVRLREDNPRLAFDGNGGLYCTLEPGIASHVEHPLYFYARTWNTRDLTIRPFDGSSSLKIKPRTQKLNATETGNIIELIDEVDSQGVSTNSVLIGLNVHKLETRLYYEGFITCLMEGTKILMGDGTEKPIENIAPGDMIMSYNPATQEKTEAMVLYLDFTGYSQNFEFFLFDDGNYLEIYQHHPIWNDHEGYLVNSKRWNVGDIARSSSLNQSTLANVKSTYYGIPKSHYTLITSNNLYFANNILCGHNDADKYTIINKRNEELNIPDSILATWKASSEAEDVMINHPIPEEELASSAEFLKERNLALAQQKNMQNELDQGDHEDFKAMEAVLRSIQSIDTTSNEAIISGFKDVIALTQKYDFIRRDELRSSLKTKRAEAKEWRDKYVDNRTHIKNMYKDRSTYFIDTVLAGNAQLAELKEWFATYKQSN